MLTAFVACNGKWPVNMSLFLFFRELDRDGDGRVSYKDFDFMMKFDPLS